MPTAIPTKKSSIALTSLLRGVGVAAEILYHIFVINDKYAIASESPNERDRRIINSLVNSVYRIDELTYSVWSVKAPVLIYF